MSVEQEAPSQSPEQDNYYPYSAIMYLQRSTDSLEEKLKTLEQQGPITDRPQGKIRAFLYMAQGDGRREKEIEKLRLEIEKRTTATKELRADIP